MRAEVALLEQDPQHGLIVAASHHCTLGSARGLFNLVVAGGTTFGGFSSATSALALPQGRGRIKADSDRTLRMLRKWHRGRVQWRNCVLQMLSRATAPPAALAIAEFLTGVCNCGECCLSRGALSLRPNRFCFSDA